MIVVSGCPRSGTSLTMDMFRVALGEDRILGEKWPARMDKDIAERGENETEARHAARMYMMDKTGRKEKADKKRAKTLQMNPNGFWEMPWTVGGVRYLPQLVSEYKTAKDTPLKVCKVVSQGLACSCPSRISQVVYLLRHPRKVAKSQENLSGRFPGDEHPEKDGKEAKVHSVSMFLQVTLQAAQWFLENPSIPTLVVEYDDMLEDPDTGVGAIETFIGEGDWNKAKARINPKLKRSEPENRSGPEWVLAEALYECVKTKDWQGVVDAVKAYEPGERGPGPVYCTRIGRVAHPKECESCKTDQNVLNNFRANAAKRKIDWAAEPCLRDVTDGEATVEESIANNHWLRVIQ